LPLHFGLIKNKSRLVHARVYKYNQIAACPCLMRATNSSRQLLFGINHCTSNYTQEKSQWVFFCCVSLKITLALSLGTNLFSPDLIYVFYRWLS
jgi:hypothetical protein